MATTEVHVKVDTMEAVITMEVTTILVTAGGMAAEAQEVTATACPPEATTAEFLLEMSVPSPVQVARRLTPVAPDFVSNAARH